MEATPVLLSFAPSVQSANCSMMRVTPSTTSGSAATMPTIHTKRRNGSGKNAMIWKSAHTATAGTHHLLTRHRSGM